MSFEVVTFLSMNGKAAEAIEFYCKHLNAKVVFKVTYEEMKKMDADMEVKEGKENWISHSVLLVGIHKIMIAEESMLPNENFKIGNNTSLCVQSANQAEIEGIYRSLIQDSGTQVITPLDKNVFSEAYGIVKDPFGVIIQLNYDARLQG